MEQDDTKNASEPQPMYLGEILEWIGTLCTFAAWFWRMGYERGKQEA